MQMSVCYFTQKTLKYFQEIIPTTTTTPFHTLVIEDLEGPLGKFEPKASILQIMRARAHFIDEKAKVQRSQTSCPSHTTGWEVIDLRFEEGKLIFNPIYLTIMLYYLV